MILFFTTSPLEMTSAAGVWSGSIGSKLISMHKLAKASATQADKPSANSLIVFAENTASQVSLGAPVSAAVANSHIQAYQHVELDILHSDDHPYVEPIFTAGDPLIEGCDSVKYSAARDASSLLYVIRKIFKQ